MKVLVAIFSILLTSISMAQNWRDTLDMARSAYNDEEYVKALKLYEQAQKGAPENIDLSDEIGQSAYRSHEYEKAEEVYQQNGGNKTSANDQAKNYHNLGNSKMKRKDYDGAIESYKEALRMNPSDEETRYNLSEAIRKKKQHDSENKQQQQNQQNQNQQNQNQQNQNQQNQQNNSGQNQQNQNGGNQGGTPKDGGSKIPNREAEKMLDELMKREAQTQRRMSGQGNGGHQPKSGKDW